MQRPFSMSAKRAIANVLRVLVFLVPSFGAGAQTAPIVRTQTGELCGIAERDVFAFKGIPYALPPLGALRWRAPKPASAWQGIRKADQFGNACIQISGIPEDFGGAPEPQSEDCLYLNVWTPKPDPAANLAVMVWIHGGAYVFGSGGVSFYSGAPQAKKGAVVVTINYRLAQLGFFAHPALDKETPGGPTNFGLLDQIAALRWVQANIVRFGGDPKNVTILGQSAGAKSVLALFASPLARGLFHKGIAQSSYAIPDTTRAKAGEVGVNVADALGLKGANATIAELRAVPGDKFGPLRGRGLSNGPVPIVGDDVLPQSIQATFAAGKEAAVPLILGDTSDDISVAPAFNIDPAAVFKRLGAAGFLVKVLYPGVKDDGEVARQAMRDLIFTMPVRSLADQHARRAPTWRYYFDYTAVNERSKFPNGVPHGGEVPYVLDTLHILKDAKDIADQDRDLARLASGYWLAFARTGAPVAKGGPTWPSHRRRGQDRTMVFAEKTAVKSNFMRSRLNILVGTTKILGAMLRRD